MLVILVLSLYFKETLPGINFAVEYKNGKMHKYIQLRKNKVIINVQIENTFRVKIISIPWHKAIQMKNFTF